MGLRDALAEAVTIDEPISPILELSQSIRKYGSQPLLFTAVDSPSGWRVGSNGGTIVALEKRTGLTGLELVRNLQAAIVAKEAIPIVEVDRAEAKVCENKSETDLTSLPIPHAYQIDAGPYLSGAIVQVEVDGIRNTSFHRMLIRGKDEVTARLVPRHLHKIVHERRERGDSTPIAVLLGPDPIILLAAAISFEFGRDEMEVAAHLMHNLLGQPLRLVRLSNGIRVPADCEVAFEAEITCHDEDEGPYVDITGTADRLRKQPLIRFHDTWHRNNPILHALVSGGAEHQTLMGLPRLPMILREVEKVAEVTDLHLSGGGSGWLSGVISLRRPTKSQVKDAIAASFRGHPSMKQVVIVDDDVDVKDHDAVDWAVQTRSQADRDWHIMSGLRGSSLDPSRSAEGITAKVGIDATIPPDADRSEFIRHI